MRPFLRWEYTLAKVVAEATGDQSLLTLFQRYLQTFCFLKFAEFPVVIDELRAELKQPPHPDTIQGLPDSRGRKFLDDANVDKDGDDVVPKFALGALPAEVLPLVIQAMEQQGIKFEK